MNQQSKPSPGAYAKMVEKASPNSKYAVSLLRAFLVGGIICCIGQGLLDVGIHLLGLDETHAAAFVSMVLVFLGATLTGIGVYDKIGKFAGAGSIVPITGFANSIVAPAMEFKREGMITGVAAKMFSIAGPVLVYGVITSIVIGLLYYFFGGMVS